MIVTAASTRDPADAPVVRVSGLDVTYATAGAVPERAVHDVSFSVTAGEVVGIVGESGSGKSTIARAILGLLPKSATHRGSVEVVGIDMLTARPVVLQHLRGNVVSLVPQDPMSSLTPVYRAGWQLTEAIQAHQDLSRSAARARAVELLDIVGIPGPEARMDQYPHELSGGMRQRIVIAMALANDPRILIADEPTTALDVTVQAQILDGLQRARQQLGVSVVLVTHDMGVIARMADRVIVMYGGRAVEEGTVRDVFYGSRMPYTLGLLAATPDIRGGRGEEQLMPIPGSHRPVVDGGCVFAARCPIRFERCVEEEPRPRSVGPAVDAGHLAACHAAETLEPSAVRAGYAKMAVQPTVPKEFQEVATPSVESSRANRSDDAEPHSVLEMRKGVKHYRLRVREPWRRRRTVDVHALCGVTLHVEAGETLAVVGESGSGKSTLARALVGVEDLLSGDVIYSGRPWRSLDRAARRETRRMTQLVPQDPSSSLDPRMTAGQIVVEPLRIHKMSRSEAARHAVPLLEMVGLSAADAQKFPSQFSGGQQQRISIARALSIRPRLVVLDEPVSALDVSVQAEVLTLLRHLQRDLGVSYVFISHDLGVVRVVADRIVVLYQGEIVEEAPTEDLFTNPRHPYTAALVSAVPIPDPDVERRRTAIMLQGDPANPVDPPPGCRFAPRCPTYRHILSAEQRRLCDEVNPALAGDHAGSHNAACHWQEDTMALARHTTVSPEAGRQA